MSNETKQNVPKLRFPKFDDFWQDEKLGDLLEIKSAARVHKDEWTDCGVPFFRSSDVVAAYKRQGNRKAFISELLFEKLAKKSGKVKRGDILITGGGSIAIPYLIQTDDPLYFKDADLLWLKRSKKTDSDYLYIFFLTPLFRKYVNSITHIGTISHYTIEQAKGTPICLPPLSEQKKIAAFLGVVDARIAGARKRRDLLETYKRGLMQALFSRTLRFTRDDGTAFPDWEEKRLGDTAKIYDGTHQTPSYVQAGVPFFSVEHLTANSFEKTKFISEDVFENECKRVRLERGDILMTRIGDIGTTRLIDWDVRASFYVSLALVKCFRSANSSFVNQFLKSEFFQRELWQRTIHVAFPKKINLGEIGNCKVRLPHPDEQQKIADCLSAMDAKIDAVTGQIAQLEAFKKGLLQQMFV